MKIPSFSSIYVLGNDPHHEVGIISLFGEMIMFKLPNLSTGKKGGELYPSLSRFFRIMLFSVAVFLIDGLFVAPHSLAQQPNIQSYGPLSYSVTNNSTTAILDFDTNQPSTQVFYLVNQTPDSHNPSAVFSLNVYLQGDALQNGGSSAPPGDGSLLEFGNSAGYLAVNQTTNQTIAWTPDRAPGSIYKLGIGAISASGQPSSTGGGDDVQVITAQNSSLSVSMTNLNTDPLSTTTLNPQGLRTAQLNGIIATSYGDQSDGDTTTAGGAVSVGVNKGSTITMTNVDPNVLTAGVSASSASGPGSKYDAVSTAQAVSVTNFGSIIIQADSGVGIMSTSTGALKPSNNANIAIGGPVSVTMGSNSSITTTGNVGVGIFAVSEAYTSGDKEKKITPVAGGAVTIVSSSNSAITTGTTNSQLSFGILAISTGTDGLLNPFTSQSVNQSGSGSGGSVSISNSASIQTKGLMSIGIAAISTGGAGILTSTDHSTNGNSTLGNNGTTWDGNGAQVIVFNNGVVTTLGSGANGIVAVSSGGGGILNNEITSETGSNGLIIGNVLSDSKNDSSSPAAGGGVLVNNAGTVKVGDSNNTAPASIGIVAQSIGGGGGTAGNHAAFFVGDNGGAGGSGGTVAVTNQMGAQILTDNVNGVGVLAQSIGGGGGNGGNADGLFVAVGGRGGSGGDGNSVVADINGRISTAQLHSAGVIAQSIGGGGGNGGGATSIGVFGDASIGGKGGSGGNGGDVLGTVEGSGTITTLQNNSSGMVLESVGGGGGTGGMAYSASAGFRFNASISVGGDGGSGGSGASVTGTNFGTITTGMPLIGSNDFLPKIDGDDSKGVLLQSVGGGGGQAGGAIAKTLAIQAFYQTEDFTVSVGGSGGTAASGGAINYNNSGSITTWGDGSTGLQAQSIGGGGGDAGDSTAGALLLGFNSNSISMTLAMGGSGGGGGSGGNVSITNGSSGSPNTPIKTHGQSADGIMIQSVGGGGGTGTMGTAKLDSPTISISTNTSTTGLELSLGGSGGNGGNNGGFNLYNYGPISTEGSGSRGIVAQTIAGGGGNAGGATASGGNNKETINLAIGGNGGDGGVGSSISSLYNWGNISTKGGDASAIMAQSIGGGGGNAGNADPQSTIGYWGNLTGLYTNISGIKYSATIGVGGTGGAGGAGGSVSVYNPILTNSVSANIISTTGDRSEGILAQSISGGGGKGGSATPFSNSHWFSPFNRDVNLNLNLGISGKGGAAANGGTTYVDSFGTINTTGYASHAIVAQSIAGGGGIGADGSLDIHANIGLGLNINEGNGNNGSGGIVQVDHVGMITTSGGDSVGVMAQSIGGGGGLGSAGTPFFSGKVSGANYAAVGFNLGLGFTVQNTTPSDGGAVTVNNYADTIDGGDPNGGVIKTAGDWSPGVLAQSIGAGGGKGGAIYGTCGNYYPDLNMQLGASNGIGNGGVVQTFLNQQGGTSEITTGLATNGTPTNGYSAFGILAQSIGGGGGVGSDGSAFSTGLITLGGASNGVSGNGGTNGLTGSGTLTSYGYGAHGIVLQSIGGGGGVGGSGSSLSPTFTNGAGVTNTSVVLGGNGSVGNGGVVSITNSALTITTAGDNAYGLLAQSIGGGGGLAAVYSPPVNGSINATSNRLGGINASGEQNGGDISLSLSDGSHIVTTGLGAHGLVVQSIGGGGGIANPYLYSNSPTGLTTSLAACNGSIAKGYGGTMNVNLNAVVTTTGDGAYGIILQTVGGGGGIIGDYAGSTGSTGSSSTASSNGNTTFVQNGTISASGSNSVGVFAQNTTAGGLGGNMNLTINGSVSGGFGSNGSGIWMSQGGNSSINVSPTGSVSALSGTAILCQNGETYTLTNNGVINGSVVLGSIAPSNFANYGTLNAGTNIFSGSTMNYGIIDPGGTNLVGSQSVFYYNLSQVSTGFLKLDIFQPNSYDSIVIGAGNSGSYFEGTLDIDFHNAVSGVTDYQLIGAGANSYNFNSINVTGLGTDDVYRTFVGTDHSFNLEVTAVPEPSTYALLGLGALALVIVARRKKV